MMTVLATRTAVETREVEVVADLKAGDSRSPIFPMDAAGRCDNSFLSWCGPPPPYAWMACLVWLAVLRSHCLDWLDGDEHWFKASYTDFLLDLTWLWICISLFWSRTYLADELTG